MSGAYLDNHTVTRPLKLAIEEMQPFFREWWGCPFAAHQKGLELAPLIKKSVARLYTAFGTKAEHPFYFTSSGEEAIAQLFLSHYLGDVRQSGRTHLLTGSIEDASTMGAIKRFEALGCFGKVLPVDTYGRLTKETLEEAVGPRTSLLSLSLANGLTGVVHPFRDLIEVCRRKEVRLHLDIGSAFGKVDLQGVDVDFLTFDGSRMHAPKGTGGLFARHELTLLASVEPTLNVAGLTALSVAAEAAQLHFDHLCTETVRLRDKLERGIQDLVPEAHVFFQEVERLPTASAMAFPGVSGEALLYQLHRKGVFATLGGKRCQKISAVLQACGVAEGMAESALSFGLSFETSEEEIDYAIEVIAASVRKLKKLSTAL
jgi:cysteine desulfurase